MKLNQTKLTDGTEVFCLFRPEARVLDSHVEGYLQHGIDIEEGDVIFDVGANIGIFGVRAFQRYKSVRVFAFEPVPMIYEALKANAQKFGGKLYHAIPCGLSDAPGDLEFTYYPYASALSTAHPEDWEKNPAEFKEAVKGALRTAPLWYARFIPSFLSGFIAKRLTANAQKVQCKLRTISEIIAEHELPRVDLLKIDCEGAELRVLKGIESKDWPKILKAVIEVHDVNGRLAEVKALLERNGLTHIHTEIEAGFEKTSMVNVFAHR